MGERGETITMENTAKIINYSAVKNVDVTLDADFKGSASSYGVRLMKFGDDDMTHRKPGAIFQLYELTKTGYKAMEYKNPKSTRNPASDDEDYKLIKVRVGESEASKYPTRKNHKVGDGIFFVTDNNGIADIKLSMMRDGVALEMHKQYALVEVVAPEGYTPEMKADGSDFYWTFIIDTIDSFGNGKYVYRDGGMMSVNNYEADEVSLNLTKTWGELAKEKIVPESVTFSLYKDGLKNRDVTITQSKDENKTTVTTTLYDAEGKPGDPVSKTVDGKTWEVTIDHLERINPYVTGADPYKWTVAETKVTYYDKDGDAVSNTLKTLEGADLGEHFDTTVTDGAGNTIADLKLDTTEKGKQTEMTFTNELRKTITVEVEKTWASTEDILDQIVFDLYRTTADITSSPDIADLVADTENTELVRSDVVLKKDDAGQYKMSFELMERFKDTKDDSGNNEFAPYNYFVVEHDAAGHAPTYGWAKAENSS